MRKTVFCVLMIVMPTPVLGDDGDDTLTYFLSKADLAIAARIASEPFGFEDEVGVVNYVCKVNVLEVLKGTSIEKQELSVNIVRFEIDPQDRIPWLKKGAKCILFLKWVGPKEVPAWQTADFWFGIQRYGPWMTRSLKRLGKRGATDGAQAGGIAHAKKFSTALAKADLNAAKEFYAPKVLLKAGSELLKPQWEIPGAADRGKDLLVERGQLIAGYRRMIERIGKDKWIGIFSKIDARKISFTVCEKADRPFAGVRKGDLVMKVATGPGDDALRFVLRPDDKGRWLVVAEATDY